ncbi:hypothetical protein PMIT1303_01088 [Prochlorococcus sp. MIT 1303]|nr:hypothetical protein PMIT1303_01088 [Prochlorococcus sp. MIT 1303]
MHPSLQRRMERLFSFFDTNNDNILSGEEDFTPLATEIANRRFPDDGPLHRKLYNYLHDTFIAENARRDLAGKGFVDLVVFLHSHEYINQMAHERPEESKAFVDKAAGDFFRLLDKDHDGWLELDDIKIYASGHHHDGPWITSNFKTICHRLGRDELRISRAEFLMLIWQYWFNPDDSCLGAHLLGDPVKPPPFVAADDV